MGKIRIRCSDADCGNELHCYSRSRRLAGVAPTTAPRVLVHSSGEDPLQRRCQVCGIHLVDWSRTLCRDTRDVEHTIEMLNTELVRHHYWHKEFSQWALNYVHRKGRRALRDAFEKRIRQSVGRSQPFRDGAQTPFDRPMEGRSALYYAQHATASCCRKCIAVWHGIPRGIELSRDDVRYLTDLGMEYFARRLPRLSERPKSVPPIPGRLRAEEDNWQR